MLGKCIKLIVALVVAGMVSACGGGGGGAPASTTSQPSSNAVNASTISWTEPTEFEDNTVASPSDIGGYKIYRGTTTSNMTAILNISDASTTQTNILKLGSGVYYFSVTAYDSNGIESKATTPILINVI